MDRHSKGDLHCQKDSMSSSSTISSSLDISTKKEQSNSVGSISSCTERVSIEEQPKVGLDSVGKGDSKKQALIPYQGFVPNELVKLNDLSSTSMIIYPTSQDDVKQENIGEKPRSILLGLFKQVKTGGDLSRVTLPTFILEPRSLLERFTDFMSHQQLLLHAHLEENPIRRFIHVLRYYLSGWHIHPKGIKKPYNPVLGEHFKCHWDVPLQLFDFDPYSITQSSSISDKGEHGKPFGLESASNSMDGLSSIYVHEQNPHMPSEKLLFCPACHTCSATRSYYVAEQVSHHPPISGYFFCNPAHHTTITGNFRPKSKFLGNSAASLMHGTTHIYFTNRPGEEYIVTNPNIYIRGIFIGTMLMELGDSITLECPKTGLIADIEFKVKGYFTGTYNAVSGKIREIDTDRVLYNISGKWTDELILTPVAQKPNTNATKKRPGLLSRQTGSKSIPGLESKSIPHASLNESINSSTRSITPSSSVSSLVSCEAPVLTGSVNTEPYLLLDVTGLHAISMNATEEPKQHPFESRRLWKDVTSAIIANDMDKATVAKTWLEDRQRATVKHRDIKKLPPPENNPFGITEKDISPFESRYFYTTDGIRWHFKKKFEGMSVAQIQEFLDHLITEYDYRIPAEPLEDQDSQSGSSQTKESPNITLSTFGDEASQDL
jgi:hypothetical protein